MSSKLISGREPLESVWRRATDQSKALLGTIRGRIVGASIAVTVLFAIFLLISPSLTGNIYIRSSLSAAVSIVCLPLIYTLMVIYALVSQRNEARDEILRIWDRLKPNLTVDKTPQIQLNFRRYINSSSLPASFRIVVQNESEAEAENCTASLLEVKPLVNWLPFVEGSTTWQKEPGPLEFSPPLPLPTQLSWLANESVVNIPPCEGAVLDVCSYSPNEYGPEYLTLSLAPDELREDNLLRVMDIVLSISIHSKDCLPVYCVCTFLPDASAGEIKYVGPDKPDLEGYRICKETPRSPGWAPFPSNRNPRRLDLYPVRR